MPEPQAPWLEGRAMRDHGTPAEQVGRWLVIFKLSGGVDFERAWHVAWGRCRFPCDAVIRHQWYTALGWSRRFFEAGWNGEEMPDMTALEAVVDAGHREVERESAVLA